MGILKELSKLILLIKIIKKRGFYKNLSFLLFFFKMSRFLSDCLNYGSSAYIPILYLTLEMSHFLIFWSNDFAL